MSLRQALLKGPWAEAWLKAGGQAASWKAVAGGAIRARVSVAGLGSGSGREVGALGWGGG